MVFCKHLVHRVRFSCKTFNAPQRFHVPFFLSNFFEKSILLLFILKKSFVYLNTLMSIFSDHNNKTPVVDLTTTTMQEAAPYQFHNFMSRTVWAAALLACLEK